MTRDEIIGIALKAGFPDWWLHPPEPERQDGEVLAMLGRFATLVATAERKAIHDDAVWCVNNYVEHLIPERIRARSKNDVA